jgi:hypothetical protein
MVWSSDGLRCLMVTSQNICGIIWLEVLTAVSKPIPGYTALHPRRQPSSNVV